MPRWSTCLAAVVAAHLLAPGEVRAQSIELNPANVRRSNGFRDPSLNPTWISRADCLGDDKFIFPLVLNGFPVGYSLQVWVGESGAQCEDINNRTGNTVKCWKVVDFTPTSTNTPEIIIPVRDIIARKIGSTISTGSESDCENSSFSLNDTPQPLDLYFLPIQGNTTGTGKIYSTKVDLLGPAAPTGVKIGIGENLLVLEWNQVSSGDITGYQFFCDPPPGSSSTGEIRSTDDPSPFEEDCVEEGRGGASGSTGKGNGGDTSGLSDGSGEAGQAGQGGQGGDEGEGEQGGEVGSGGAGFGGSGGSGVSSGDGRTNCAPAQGSSCPSVNLIGGKILKNPEKYLCGSASGLSATKGSVSNLTNFQRYTVAIAAVDGVGNVGPLSPLVCETPQPIDDFYKVYRDAGGRAGGGYCQVNLTELPRGGSLPLLGVLASLGALALRSRWRCR
ncbi:MAG: hypothetical protein RMJ98_03685 [Myxococcales bacterium]|nr:hypothetical protein [Polyangiaceae bacterium]MDW8248390.1 hypothetical protein [Myxococcales bacterium]